MKNRIEAISVATLITLSVASVGAIGGLILSEAFGLTGYVVAYSGATLFALAAYFGGKEQVRKPDFASALWLVVALATCSAGLGAARIIHGVHEVEVAREQPRLEAIAQRDACIASTRENDAARRAAYKASRGTAPTATYKRYDADLKEAISACKADFAVPAKVESLRLADLTFLDWFKILGPVLFEIFCALALKVLAKAMAKAARRREQGAEQAEADVDARAKRSAAARKGAETRRRNAAAKAEAAAKAKRSAAARKGAETRRRNAAARKAAEQDGSVVALPMSMVRSRV